MDIDERSTYITLYVATFWPKGEETYVKFTIQFVLISVLILSSSAALAQSNQVDLSAEPIVRAQQAIAMAKARGHDVRLTDVELAAFIEDFENSSFSVTAGQSSFVFTAAHSDVAQAQAAKQYTCSASTSGLFTGVTVNWWAYGNVDNGRIIGDPYSTGFNHSYYGAPGSYAVVTGSVTAYTNNGGRRIQLDMNGTLSIYMLDIHVGTYSLNLTCSQSA